MIPHIPPPPFSFLFFSLLPFFPSFIFFFIIFVHFPQSYCCCYLCKYVHGLWAGKLNLLPKRSRKWEGFNMCVGSEFCLASVCCGRCSTKQDWGSQSKYKNRLCGVHQVTSFGVIELIEDVHPRTSVQTPRSEVSSQWPQQPSNPWQPWTLWQS